jgi:murein L,D-transpeptidase YafK
MHNYFYRILSIFLLCAFTQVSAQDLLLKSTPVNVVHKDHELLLVQALSKINKNELDGALKDLEILVSVNPKFRLAQLVYGDLLMAKSRAITDFGNLSYAPYKDIVALREEAKSRWEYSREETMDGKLPRSFINMDESHKYAVIVDLSKPRLYIFENVNGDPKLIVDYYATIGKNGMGKVEEGDQRTPVGVYFTNDFIDPEELPDLYGDGAFPLNYPNAWDRRNGNTGYGIWIHGTPSNTYSRPPRDSDGCVIVSNQDFLNIYQYILGKSTPVILADNVDWINKDEWLDQRLQFQQALEQWRVDWESRDADQYLRHYSAEYEGLGKNYKDWVSYKKRVNPSKEFIKIKLSDTSMFRYTNGLDILVVTFNQDYQSNDVQRKTRKRQYWKMENDGQWRIFFEDTVS